MPKRNHSTLRFRVLAFLVLGLSTLWTSHTPAQISELRRTPIVRAVERTRPSVVNIQGRKTVSSSEGTSRSSADSRQVNGMGTGVVIDPRGYVITNYHVVQDVARIQVTLSDRRSVVGQLLAHDPDTDLAVIKIPVDKPLPVISIGRSDDLLDGETVIALGNAYGYEHTTTRGIISALHRTVQVSDNQYYYDLIQTDASINPGNSGGPLLNIEGDMIAVNVAVRVGAQGIGFAIPVDQVMDVASKLMSIEQIEGTQHGITGRTVHRNGASEFHVTSVASGSPASAAGVRKNDIITNINGIRIQRAVDVERGFLGNSAGDAIDVTVQRDGEAAELTLALGNATASSSELASSLDRRTWSQLGVKLAPVSSVAFSRYKSDYNGGMRISAVRPDGPAARQGVRSGDILLGLHIWETITEENVKFVLNHKDLVRLQPMKFYILRSGDTLFGHIRLASMPR